jgi:hypothetical protein
MIFHELSEQRQFDLAGAAVTPQKCTSVGRPACERSISCQLPRTNGLSSDGVSAAGAATREAMRNIAASSSVS